MTSNSEITAMLRSIFESFSGSRYPNEAFQTNIVKEAESLLEQMPDTEVSVQVTQSILRFIDMGKSEEHHPWVTMASALADIYSQWATYVRYVEPNSEDYELASQLDEEVFAQLVGKYYIDSLPPNYT